MGCIAAFLCGLLYGALAYHAHQVDEQRARARRMRERLDEWISTPMVNAGSDFWKAYWPDSYGSFAPRDACQCAEPLSFRVKQPCETGWTQYLFGEDEDPAHLDKLDCDSTCGDACQCSTSVPVGDNATGCMDG